MKHRNTHNDGKTVRHDMTETNKKRFTKILLKRYSLGETTQEENDAVEKIESSLFKKQKKAVSEEIVNRADDRQRKLLSEKLHIKFPERAQRRRLNTSFFIYGSAAVAAVALLLITILPSQLHRQGNNPIFTANARMQEYQSVSNIQTISLPDGSIVKLNKGTTLKIEEKAFNKNDREVWLEGEAFFEVAKNATKPFIIHSKQITTTVLGTSFNVCAYSNLPFMKINVREGKVQVNNQDATLDILTANKQLTFEERNGTHETVDKEWNDTQSWMSGQLVLEAVGLDELKLRTAQFYDYTLTVNTSKLNEAKFSAILPEHSSINDLLNLVAELYGVTYRIQNKTVIISG